MCIRDRYVVAFPVFLLSSFQMCFLAHSNKAWNPLTRLALYIAVGVAALITFVLAWMDSELMPCMVIGCVNASLTSLDRGEQFTAGGGLKQVWLVGMCFTSAIMLAAQVLLIWLNTPSLREWLWKDAQETDTSKSLSHPHNDAKSNLLNKEPLTSQDLEARDKRTTMIALFLMFGVMLPFLFLASCILPNAWERFLVNRMVAEAQMSMSTPDAQGGSNCGSDAPPGWCPEVRDAYFRTHSFRISENVNGKVYPDIAMFYGYIYAMAVWTLLGCYVTPLRRALHAPVRALWKVGTITLHRVGVFFMTSMLLICWFLYFIHDHRWNGGANPKPAEVYGRTLGVTATLVMGLLMLPVSRNSILSKAMSLSWESMLYVHIVLGYSLFAIVFAHMGCFYKTYDEQGSFPSDILAVPMQFPLNGGTVNAGDNFTIPLATVVMILAIVLILIPSYHVIRRARFEVFYYSHHFFVVLYITVLIHAHNGWYFILPGLCTYIIDRCCRWVYTATTPLVVVDISAEAEITALTVRRVAGKGLEHTAGQYMMINVPAISAFEWHPFTISSAPQDEHSTFHIKAMPSQSDGVLTWTEQLNNLAAVAATDTTARSHLVVNCEGPYGRPPVWGDYSAAEDTIVLAAGGIGVTPLNSTLRHLSHQAEAGLLQAQVHLVWVCRDANVFTLPEFAKTLALVEAQSPQFKVSLYDTSMQSKNLVQCIDTEALSGKLNAGRPDWHELLGSEGRGLVYACGPAAMVDQVRCQAAEQGEMHFFTETFEL
eukprot:TRINITY_DN868_c0_g1_i4.p1 TRINITY_DN868_c0_g1~~TRINITY_DN868_c0_g1_i4.p1  ORF type:complete len:767 (+),score=132.44 TRINITY_DN868_c0_g1_i4:143-2443(+)